MNSIPPPSSPSEAQQAANAVSKTAWHERLIESFWTWLLSLIFMIGVPCLPLAIEAAKNTGKVRPDSYYMTAAVLAASYGIATNHKAFMVGYSCGFLAPIILL